MDDRELLNQILEKNEEATKEFVDTYSSYIRRWISKYSFLEAKGFTTMEDLHQNCLIAVYDAALRFDCSKNVDLKTYMYQVVKNTVLKEINRLNKCPEYSPISYEYLSREVQAGKLRRYAKSIVDPNASAFFMVKENEFESNLELDFLKGYRGNLKKTKKIIELLKLGYKYDEIAKELNIPMRELYNFAYRIKLKAKVDSKD